MLPHYVGEDIVEKEERDQTKASFGKCNKCFVEMNHDKHIKNRKKVEVVIIKTEQKKLRD